MLPCKKKVYFLFYCFILFFSLPCFYPYRLWNGDFFSCSKFPMRNNNKGDQQSAFVVHIVTPGCPHSFSSTCKQNKSFFLPTSWELKLSLVTFGKMNSNLLGGDVFSSFISSRLKRTRLGVLHVNFNLNTRLTSVAKMMNEVTGSF